MQPLTPDPLELVGANLRRAYRAAPPVALPERLSDLLAQIARHSAKSAPGAQTPGTILPRSTPPRPASAEAR